jgi:long-chain acyl-CoA synthetase
LVPSFASLKGWMNRNNIPFTTNEDAVKNEAVIKLYQSIVDKSNETFNHVEQVKRFRLLPKEWSVETGEMTPKLSVKRKNVMEKYKEEIEKIYES